MTTQAEVLRKCLEVVKQVAEATIVLDTYTGSDVAAVRPLYIPQAAALLPRLEKIFGEMMDETKCLRQSSLAHSCYSKHFIKSNV